MIVPPFSLVCVPTRLLLSLVNLAIQLKNVTLRKPHHLGSRKPAIRFFPRLVPALDLLPANIATFLIEPILGGAQSLETQGLLVKVHTLGFTCDEDGDTLFSRLIHAPAGEKRADTVALVVGMSPQAPELVTRRCLGWGRRSPLSNPFDGVRVSLVRDKSSGFLGCGRRVYRFLFGFLCGGNLGGEFCRPSFAWVLGIGFQPRPAGESDNLVLSIGGDSGYSDEGRWVMDGRTKPADMQLLHLVCVFQDMGKPIEASVVGC